MRFKNVCQIGFICVLMGLYGTISVKADISIDKDHNSRILIGPNLAVDWVDVGCIFRKSEFGTELIKVWCDDSPIESIHWVDPYWSIFKKHSLWHFYLSDKPENSLLLLIDHN